ncbi:MAG: hypothetical protein M3314_10345 [Actinomycetota bacterium]|nr:hypothetical protein [Actinomycetota bacterium]
MPTLTDRARPPGQAGWREAEDLLLEPAPPVPLTPLVLVVALVLAVVLLWTLIWGFVGPF